jgi:hypothetical protein
VLTASFKAALASASLAGEDSMDLAPMIHPMAIARLPVAMVLLATSSPEATGLQITSSPGTTDPQITSSPEVMDLQTISSPEVMDLQTISSLEVMDLRIISSLGTITSSRRVGMGLHLAAILQVTVSHQAMTHMALAALRQVLILRAPVRNPEVFP